MTGKLEPEVGLAAAVSYSEENECKIRGEIVVDTTGTEVLDASSLMVENMDDLVERLKDDHYGEEIMKMANSLKVALKMIDKQSENMDMKDKIILDLQQRLEEVTTLKNRTEKLVDTKNEVIQEDNYESHISDALVMVNKLQRVLELAQGHAFERLQERQKIEKELMIRDNKISDLENKMKDVNWKLEELYEENQEVRRKLEWAVHSAQKTSSNYGAELEKCYEQDLRSSEEIQKYKRIIGRVESEIEQLNKRCGKCKIVRVGDEIDRWKKQMGLPKLNVSAEDNLPSSGAPGNTSGGSVGSKCVVCGEPFSRSLDVTDYIRLLIIS